MIRLLIALPFAALITVTLFGFMAWLVDSGNTPLPDPDSVLRFDVVQVEQEREAQRRQRQLPEPPKQPELAPSTTLAQPENQSQQITTELPKLPALNLATSVNGMAIGKPAPLQVAQNSQVLPLHRIEPKYPARALKRKIEGYVVMRFSIDTTGKPTDIEVVKADPQGVFDREATRALLMWKYQPQVVDGKAVKREGQTVKLEFKLQK
jgi:protein TonB